MVREFLLAGKGAFGLLALAATAVHVTRGAAGVHHTLEL